MIETVPPLLSIFGDAGLAERFNHGKWVVIIILMMIVFARTKAPIFMAIAAVFCLVLADDALRLHENGGAFLQANWPGMPTFGLSAGEAGEVLIWLALAAIVLPITAWGLFFTRRPWWPVVGYIGFGFAGLVFFGIVVDILQEPLHHIANPSLRYWTIYFASIVECAGEALFASLTTAYAIGIHRVYGMERASARNGVSLAE